ncbi:helix-turn-helix domain-containing protein [Cocleimonas sp. KMM 6892]|uniref:IclR family transcriptional regulator n=1 Tax=unclassified Cocleimonas TaxID=2639732 RepID=UPI002DBE9B38|nr:MULTISPECIES: IclR family transcriptional regulator C-terminal domain-containing protein [unclassified Cocleimonas]MEB8433268.1 helix-turn-helix domain-containing protein [Cocleimonas sp. KMM 6892]MEC4715751.1 helix-turn-helix domain-containing protein [Cocleimonas sp. KMM 6895]MEC4745212.1 helix-turn-helix domain-containing protein [Cocleimonas sp. KMM 6896]
MKLMKKIQKGKTLQTVSRAITILRCFKGGTLSLGLADLTNIMELNKVTVLRIAKTLVEEGMLNKDTESGEYTISYGVLELVRELQNPSNIISFARPILQKMHELSGETVLLSLRDGNDAVVEHEIPSLKPIKYSLGIGYRADLRIGAVGQAILSCLSNEEIENLLNKPEVKDALGDLLTEADIRKNLKFVQSQDFLCTTGQRVAGAAGVAAPFATPCKSLVGSVSIVLPETRFTTGEQNHFATIVKEGAMKINAILAGNPRALEGGQNEKRVVNDK